jgi:beta-lactamase regulating signal transducer with metallopeptidase domain
MTTLFSGTGPLLLFVAKATLVLVAAIAATFLLRRGTAGERHLVWLAALVGVLALPVLSRIPALQFGILPSRLAPAGAPQSSGPRTIVIASSSEGAGAPVVVSTAPSGVGPATTIRIGEAAAAIAPMAGTVVSIDRGAAVAPAAVAEGPSWAGLPSSMLRTIAIVWAAVAAALLGWLALGALQVRRIVATATELTSPDWTMPLCEVADRLDLEQPPRLVASDRIEMAFACRALAPTIVLPVSSENWNDDRRRAVLFHELAHVKRHDLVSHMLGRIACALYWFHPLVWTAARNLRNESEKACDDLVLSCGARASDYAQHLLDMVTSVRNYGAPALGIPMARKKEFEGRMLAILDPAIRRVSRGRLHAAGVILGLSALSLTIAAAVPARSEAAETSAQSPVAIDAGLASARAEGAAQASTSASASASSSSHEASSNSDGPALVDGEKLGRAIGRIAGSAVKQTFAQLGIAQGQAKTVVDSGRIALLIKVLQTDADAGVRRSAAWALADAETSAGRAALVRALQSDSDDQVREMSAWALGEQSAQDGAEALGNALLHDKSARVRETAAWALGEAGRRADGDALVSALSDSNARVREMAIWALGEIGMKSAPPTLINALGDSSSQVREITAWALGEIADDAAVPALTRAFKGETESHAKRMYLWALAEIGDAPTDLIESAMKSSDAELRRHAVALLTGSGSWPMPMPRPMPRPTP